MATTARDFFKAADGHRRAVELLQPHEFRNDGNRDSLFFAIYNVLGFTVELYLKAYLANSGMRDNELWAREYGHNLKNLFAEARRRGFAVRLNDMAAIIDFLAAGHGEYAYRYVQDEGVLNYFNDLNPVVYALQQVHVSMQDDLG
jgi:hypothetical protein